MMKRKLIGLKLLMLTALISHSVVAETQYQSSDLYDEEKFKVREVIVDNDRRSDLDVFEMIKPIEWGIACEDGVGYAFAYYIPTGYLSTVSNDKACSQTKEALPSGVFYIENKRKFIPYGYTKWHDYAVPPFAVIDENRDLFIKGTIESNFETTVTFTPIKKTVADIFCGSDFALAAVFDMYTGGFDLSQINQCDHTRGFRHALVSLKEITLSGKNYVIGYSDAFGTLDLIEIERAK